MQPLLAWGLAISTNSTSSSSWIFVPTDSGIRNDALTLTGSGALKTLDDVQITAAHPADSPRWLILS